jgi:TPR repeat protein
LSSNYKLDPAELSKQKESALSGDRAAAVRVCLHYQIGLADERPAETFFWLTKAAVLGDVPSQYNLGVYYEERRHDAGNALKWYDKAAAAGDKVAELKARKLRHKLAG